METAFCRLNVVGIRSDVFFVAVCILDRYFCLSVFFTDFKVDDGFNILKLKVREAERDRSLNYIASTYDPYDQIIRDGIYEGGRKIISFCGVLQQGVFPLPELLQLSMKHGAESMRRPVEIEFACNLNNDRTGELYLLQIRPIVDTKQVLNEDLTQIAVRHGNA